MNETLRYKVYDNNRKFLAEYGIGWNVAEIFNGTTGADLITIMRGPKEISAITKNEVKAIK